MAAQQQNIKIPKQAMAADYARSKPVSAFPGGLHPKDNKHYTQDCSIEIMPAPDQLAIGLSQHIGAVCKPVVSKRDKVTAGQVVGKSDAFVSAPVHSPVNGTVKEISLVSHPVLGRETAVIIDTDKEAENGGVISAEKFDGNFDARNYESEQICNAVSRAGIVGLGGAGFPTRVKIEANPKSAKEIIIINGCECEPFLTCDYRVMLEWSYQVIAGIKLTCRASGCYKVRIGIEDNKPKAIAAMGQALAGSKDAGGIEIVTLKTRYPQGGERQLIKAVTGKQVPTGGIPPMIGVAVLNVTTCAAIADAVVFDKPLTHKIVTVTGPGITRPGNVYAPVGTRVRDLIDHCGGAKEAAAKVVMGGPMTGFAIADLDTPITKTSGGILLLNRNDVGKAKYEKRQTPCIRCGRCLSVCPEVLNPTKIAHAVRHGDIDLAKNYYMAACIECGCCSYVCPANIELTGYIKTGKILDARARNRMPK